MMCDKIPEDSNPFACFADVLEGPDQSAGSADVNKKTTPSTSTPEETKVPLVTPTTFSSWLYGVLNGGEESWILRYMESEFFELARQRIKTTTGGFDVHMVLLAFAGLNAARVRVPMVLSSVLEKVKEQTTSSIVIDCDGATEPICREILKIAGEKREEELSKSSKFRGHHEELVYNHTRESPIGHDSRDYDYVPLPGNAMDPFWHNGVRYVLERSPPSSPYMADETLTVRCFGHSREPVRKLIMYAEQRLADSKQVPVSSFRPNQVPHLGPYSTSMRPKRPLDTVDLDPQMMADITADIERFLHPKSKAWYEATGRPYRHGYLFHGPPGTGKTSLALALASYTDSPLYIISLNGLTDELLQSAFTTVLKHSIVLLEDVDCAGANIGNRGTQAVGTSPTPSVLNEHNYTSDAALASKLESFMEKQELVNERFLNKLTGLKGKVNGLQANHADPPAGSPDQPKHKSEEDKAPAGTISLSGLLNVIDGANAKEDRVLIMTTNHPNKLDPALLRAGRIERKFELTYASKSTSLLTFKRIFGNEVIKRYTPEAIDRFADLFAAQFPSHSRITTAELAKYCGQYGGRPEQAIADFANWLKVGAELFNVPADYTQLSDEQGIYNIPEPFDREQLNIQPTDLIEEPLAEVIPTTQVAAAAAAAPQPTTQPTKPRSWNPLTCWHRHDPKTDEFNQLRAELLSDTINPPDQPQSSLLDAFNKAYAPNSSTSDPSTLHLNTPTRHVSAIHPHPISPTESLWDASHHRRVCPVPLTPTTSSEGSSSSPSSAYRCVSPRPISIDYSDEEFYDMQC